MLEGTQRLQNFSRLLQKANYHLSNDNIIMATKGIAKLTKKITEESDFLKDLNVYDYINTQIEDFKYKITTNIEKQIMQFLFLSNESSMKLRVEKLFDLYRKDFEKSVEENQRSIASDFGVMVKSTLFEKYLDFITGEYTINRLRQVDATLDLIEKYEKERKNNLIVSGGMEKLMLNTNDHLNSQNISHFVLLLYCYSQLDSFAHFNEVFFLNNDKMLENNKRTSR